MFFRILQVIVDPSINAMPIESNVQKPVTRQWMNKIYLEALGMW